MDALDKSRTQLSTGGMMASGAGAAAASPVDRVASLDQQLGGTAATPGSQIAGTLASQLTGGERQVGNAGGPSAI